MPKKRTETKDAIEPKTGLPAEVFEAYGGKCPVCDREFTEDWKIDYDIPGKNGVRCRGFLCRDCWLTVQTIHYNFPHVKRAINYLMERSPKHRLTDRDFRAVH